MPHDAADPIAYRSTRGGPPLSFEAAVLNGLAPDGGLYLPERLPHFAPEVIAGWQGMPYATLAARILAPFTAGTLTQDALERMCAETYAAFRHPAVAPLKQLSANDWLLELFHGPTLAFKDFALQFLGRLLDPILARKRERVTILGATSGDTGSAAIHGCRGREHVDIVILYPHGRVSDVQRRQMTTVRDANVHCLAIDGTFDDCQRIVKTLFLDPGLRDERHLVAVNSINWARILAQVVYYFYAAVSLGAPARRLSFSVPTGNFGDIYAGYLARAMGLPVEKLIVATNSNDILARTIQTGVYEKTGVTPTLSPSMDIEVSSNFERLLFDLYDHDASAVRASMESLLQGGRFQMPAAAYRKLRALFAASRTDDQHTLATIRAFHQATGELLDPHTAVGLAAAQAHRAEVTGPLVTLSTAHPAKFPEAVRDATGVSPELPAALTHLMAGEERFTRLPNDPAAIKAYLRGKVA
ncbi:MAG: threonine synthase [Acetobacteraceae bacterium]